MEIELQQVNKYYNRGKENEVHALKDIDLRVNKGEAICLRGPSGCGKSTLLSIIGCVFPPTSGSATVSEKKLSRLPDHFLTRLRREKIGFIFQRFNLIESISVIDNVTLPLLPLGVKPGERARRGGVLLERFGISHRRNFRVDRISGGEMQRVGIARALISDPPIILADEPTAHLDSVLSEKFMQIMDGLKSEGKTLVITSHDPIIYNHPLIDKLYTMIDGRISEMTVS